MEVETPMLQSIPGGATAKPFVTSSHTIYLSQIFITFVILQFCNIPRLLSISAMILAKFGITVQGP
jgi:hypothetical protein